MRRILLKTCDNQIYEVEEAIAKQSGVIRNFLEDFDGDCVEIPLLKVNERMLKVVMEWCAMHAGEELEEKELQDWESKFVAMDDLDFLYEVLMAANYLEVVDLVHRLCKKVADIIAGKQPEEIRKIFNIENDFTPEEEAELRKRNAWTLDPKNK
ncbi:SKP1-like protein 14 [Momordica charantia]|uniref:SKP1-like protein n=1 Tax=Momordica charantia TaxID=3673 RepID=A0A6J1CDL6_MOMCH|nr:SKP1-like protein 14 [Momordica charantia]